MSQLSLKVNHYVETGLRAGYAWAEGDYEYQVSAFVRNMFDEQQVIGAIDFNNNTGNG